MMENLEMQYWSNVRVGYIFVTSLLEKTNFTFPL